MHRELEPMVILVGQSIFNFANFNSMITVMFGMSEILTTVLTETQNYPLSACISDTGGAIGLFLGLNMIGEFF